MKFKYWLLKLAQWILRGFLAVAGALVLLPIVVGGWLVNLDDSLEREIDKLKKEIENEKQGQA